MQQCICSSLNYLALNHISGRPHKRFRTECSFITLVSCYHTGLHPNRSCTCTWQLLASTRQACRSRHAQHKPIIVSLERCTMPRIYTDKAQFACHANTSNIPTDKSQSALHWDNALTPSQNSAVRVANFSTRAADISKPLKVCISTFCSLALIAAMSSASSVRSFCCWCASHACTVAPAKAVNERTFELVRVWLQTLWLQPSKSFKTVRGGLLVQPKQAWMYTYLLRPEIRHIPVTRRSAIVCLHEVGPTTIAAAKFDLTIVSDAVRVWQCNHKVQQRRSMQFCALKVVLSEDWWNQGRRVMTHRSEAGLGLFKVSLHVHDKQ